MCNSDNTIKDKGEEGRNFRDWIGVGQWEDLLILKWE